MTEQQEICQDCWGSGWATQFIMPCPSCKGTGKILPSPLPHQDGASAEDANRLRTLADWFDVYDAKNGNIGMNEVQTSLLAIANRIEYACSAQSSIGEDEKNRIVQEVMEMHPYKVPGKPHTYSDYNQGWEDACDILDQHLTKWAISRLSERKIVLPEQKREIGLTSDYAHSNGWNDCIESIKRLNGIN